MKNNEYLQLFLDETEEMVDRLATNLVSLEKKPSHHELIAVVFRDAHTIKGSSGAMGYTQMASIAHHMESVLSLLRENELAPTAQVFTALLSALDLLKSIKQDIYRSGSEGRYELAAVLAELDSFASSQTASPAMSTLPLAAAEAAASAAAAEAAASAAAAEYKVDVTLRPDAPMKGVRAFLLLQSLRSIGLVMQCEPSEEHLLSEKFDQRFAVILSTDRHSDEVLAMLGNDGDVEDVSVAPFVAKKIEQEATDKVAAKVDTRQHSVRVDVRKLEALMNLVGELVIERNRLANVTTHLERQNKEDENVRTLMAVSSQLGRITGDLQREIMKVRMVPIAQLFGTFPRLVRDLAQSLEKTVELTLEGADTELDRTIVEEVRDPLIHLVRNSVDHGIETTAERLKKGKSAAGRVVLSARHQDNQVVISVKDDGGGIDAAAVAKKAIAMGLMTENDLASLSEAQRQRLILLPGLSTATQVSNVSGRGVGMDIVRSQIEKLGGSIDIESITGQGTEFIIRLPLTLAIFRALLVRANELDYALPIATVIETRKLNPADLRVVKGQECLVLREQIVPVVALHSLFELPSPAKKPQSLVIAASGTTKVGLLVDRLLGEQEVVLKPLGPFFARNKELAGATILGDGRVVPILDINGLLGLMQKR